MNGFYQPYWTQPDELEHYGVKGMKWGVRKKRTDYSNTYTDDKRKRDRRIYGDKGVEKIEKYMKRGLDYNRAKEKHFDYRRNVRLVKNAGKLYMTNVIVKKAFDSRYESLLEKGAKNIARGTAYLAKNALLRKKKINFDNVVAWY